jgi:hypothetical protein
MTPEEEAKKEEERKFQERVDARVAKEAEDIRKRAEARGEAENKALRDELKKLKDAETARAQAEEDAAHAAVEELKKEVDPALLALLPEKLSALDQADWLRKAKGEAPAPGPVKMPETPRGIKTDPKFQPVKPKWAGTKL